MTELLKRIYELLMSNIINVYVHSHYKLDAYVECSKGQEHRHNISLQFVSSSSYKLLWPSHVVVVSQLLAQRSGSDVCVLMLQFTCLKIHYMLTNSEAYGRLIIRQINYHISFLKALRRFADSVNSTNVMRNTIS